MNEETEDVRSNDLMPREVDAFDRRILAALTEDARSTYAAIGQVAGLSAPAVHERVKRLKGMGVLRGTTTRVNGEAVGKPFLAFVHIDAEGWGKSEQMMRMKVFPEVEEIHSVAGDTSVIMKVRTAGPHALEHFLAQLYALPGVRSTRSFVVLSTYLERPVQASITKVWPETQMPMGRT